MISSLGHFYWLATQPSAETRARSPKVLVLDVGAIAVAWVLISQLNFFALPQLVEERRDWARQVCRIARNRVRNLSELNRAKAGDKYHRQRLAEHSACSFLGGSSIVIGVSPFRTLSPLAPGLNVAASPCPVPPTEIRTRVVDRARRSSA